MNLSYVHGVETTLEYALTHGCERAHYRGADLRVAQEETTC